MASKEPTQLRLGARAEQPVYLSVPRQDRVLRRVYEDWQQQEVGILRKLLAANASDAKLVRACVAHHKAYLNFRRSLRRLAVEDPRVRAARSESRLRQIDFLKRMSGTPADPARLAVVLLQLERLSDAVAEGELADMGLSSKATEARLAELIHEVRRPAAGAG